MNSLQCLSCISVATEHYSSTQVAQLLSIFVVSTNLSIYVKEKPMFIELYREYYLPSAVMVNR